MGRHGENIRKRKDGRWEARYIQRYNANGKAVYRYLYGRTYKEVKEKRLKEQSKLQMETPQIKTNLLKMPFEEIAYQWLDSKKNMVKESTYANYVYIIQKHLLPELGEVYVTAITEEKMEEFLLSKLKKGRLNGVGGLSIKTVSDIRSVLKMIMCYAKNRGFHNMAEINLSLPSGQLPQIHVLSSCDQLKLEATLFQDVTPFHLGIITSLYTGLRIGEICALQWKDFDFEAEVIHISKTVIRIQNTDPNAETKTKILIEKPKTVCSIRTIPLPDSLLPYYKENQREPEVYLLTGTTHFMEPRSCLQKYKKVLREAGIGDYSYHALRHTFATRCVEQNFDIKSLSEIMGHSSVTITMQRYVHPSLKQKKIQMNKLPIMTFQSQNDGQE